MRRIVIVSSLLSSLGLTGCLFFGFATVGGTLTGLPSGSSVILQNNGKDNLTLTQNGRFTFNNTLDDGDDYNVTVLTQPGTATCTPSNNTGKINSKGDDVENVLITCAVTGNLTGTISGLQPGTVVTLANAGITVQVSTNGSFAFPVTLANNTAYNVTVSQQPYGLTCGFTGGSNAGTFVTGTPTNIVVVCS